MKSCQFVTGATGLLGSHLVEQLILAGYPVRALVRGSSDTRFLRSLGVECIVGNLIDSSSFQAALAGVENIFHAAAKVGDWGTRTEFQRDTIAGTRVIAQAALRAGVNRLVHISSTSAYGHPEPTEKPIDETWPRGEKFWLWDDYTRAKVAAEGILWEMHQQDRLPMTIIRPSWLYGPRDRLTMRRIQDSLIKKRVRIIGPGTNRMNTVYAGSVAHCCLLAAQNPQARGQAYNVTNDGSITQKEWFDLWAEMFELPKPTKHVSYGWAFGGGLVLESMYRLAGARNPPFITRYAAWLLGRPTFYSTAKAERELNWKPVVTYLEGVRRAVEWYRTQNT